jgi:gluconolactonase
LKMRLVVPYVMAAGLLSLSSCSSTVPAKETNPPTTAPSEANRPTSPATASPTGIPGPAQKTAVWDVAEIGSPVLISDKFIFTEGPVWDRTRNALLFSDVDASRIYQLTLPDTITVFRDPSNGSNGLAFDTEGRLLAAEHGSRRVTRTLPDGTVEVLAGSYTGKQLNSPNDLVVRSDGTVYFTDPTFGLANRPRGLDFTGLFRISPSGELILEGTFDKSPNGVALSPDEKTLYLALTAASQVLAFDVAIDGKIGNRRDFAAVPQPDGMAVDVLGNLYVAGFDGICVFSQAGAQLCTIKTRQQPTNCDFGGPRGDILFITARGSLYSVAVPIPGFQEGR